MHPVLIFRHVEYEGPGYLQDFLLRENIPFNLVCVDANDSIPDNPGNASGLVFMGGHMSVNDPLPWISAELRLIQMAIAQDIPVLGHCLGGQLIARALGASIIQNPVDEIGWHTTWKVANQGLAPCLAGLDNKLELFHWHSETFTLPAGAQPILKSAFCENQGFVTGKTLAMQCHIEMTEVLVQDWAERSRTDLIPSESVQSADEMMHDLPGRIARLNRVADHVYRHWARGLNQY
jgi:GMP synthase-like glutamine amidotransferase